MQKLNQKSITFWKRVSAFWLLLSLAIRMILWHLDFLWFTPSLLSFWVNTNKSRGIFLQRSCFLPKKKWCFLRKVKQIPHSGVYIFRFADHDCFKRFAKINISSWCWFLKTSTYVLSSAARFSYLISFSYYIKYLVKLAKYCSTNRLRNSLILRLFRRY